MTTMKKMTIKEYGMKQHNTHIIHERVSQIRAKRLSGLVLAMVGFFISIFAVQTGITAYRSYAKSALQVRFDKPSYRNTGTSDVKIMVDGGNNSVGFVKAVVSFDPTKMQLAAEPAVASVLTRKIDVTNMRDANATGKVVITLGLDPANIRKAPATSFELARFTLKPVAGTNAVLVFDEDDMQIVDINAQDMQFTTQDATFGASSFGSMTVSKTPAGTSAPKATKPPVQIPAATGTPTTAISPTPNIPSPGGLLAFPGAEGFGSRARGGRGGAVIRVTSLSDSGAGSLRACLEANGPRYCIFDVSGMISLSQNITISNPYVTLAGESAPSPGVTIQGGTISVKASDIIIRHIRFRVGNLAGNPPLSERDGFKIQGPQAKNAIIDHISVSWAVDENISMWYGGAENITVSNSIVSEALHNAGHAKGPHSKGILVGDGIHNVSLINILGAHNDDRNFLAKGGATVQAINNLYYNWSEPKATGLGSGGGTATVVGNVYIKGPNTSASSQAFQNNDGTGKIYITDTKLEGVSHGLTSNVSSYPIWNATVSPDPSASVESMLYRVTGARPKDRDAVDTRIINEVKTRTGKIIDSVSQVGGWPPLAHNTRPFPVPISPNGDDDRDGYTNLEEVLHQYAAGLE